MQSKREKIVVGLAALSVLYGAYVYLIEPKQKANQKTATQSSSMIPWLQSIQTTLTGTQASPLQGVVVQRALESWPNDLVLDAPLPAELIAEEKRRQEEAKQAALAAAEAKERDRKAKLAEEQRRENALRELTKRFVYSGYAVLDVPGPRTPCAIINGIVYRAGETLEGSDHTVKTITPEEVTIVSPEQAIEVHIPITK